MIQTRPLLLLAIASLAILTGGCASAPDIRVSSDPATAFSGYQTFGFMPQLGTDGPGGRTMFSARLIAATTRELDARGLQFVSNNPDLLVNFFSGIQSGVQMANMPIFVMPVPNYGAWHGYQATFAPGERIDDGTLGVHLVDRRSNRLVWEGIARDRVTDAMREDPDGTVNALIAGIFSGFSR